MIRNVYVQDLKHLIIVNIELIECFTNKVILKDHNQPPAVLHVLEK